MAIDPVARGLVAAEAARRRRLRTLETLRASLARTGAQPIDLASTLPVIGAPTASTAIPSGTTWQVSSGGNPLHAAKYTFVGAVWKNLSATFPNGEFYRGEVAHQGNGSR